MESAGGGGRAGRAGGRRRSRGPLALALAGLVGASGCVTMADYEKLRVRVVKLERGQGGTGSPEDRSRFADLASEVERLGAGMQRLQGRVEVSEHEAKQALEEARSARAQSAAGAATPGAAMPGAAGAAPAEAGEPAPEPGSSADEVAAYRAAYAHWRSNETNACIDRFRNFLQTYPASAYADDAAYWMADCYFKNGDFKTAVLRFDDVVARYPKGNKAADALYRQGEALLRLGPNYGKAASKAFERVVKEYPDSALVPQARRQLEVLKAG